MPDTHLSHEEFRKLRNKCLVNDKVKDELAYIRDQISEFRYERLIDAIGENIAEYGDDRESDAACSCGTDA